MGLENLEVYFISNLSIGGVLGEPAGKNLVLGLPSRGSAGHVDRREV